MLMLLVSASTPSAAAGLCIVKRATATREEQLDTFSDRVGVSFEVNVNSDLLEAGEGPHAHSASQEDSDPMLFEEVDGPHAPVLLMRGVLEDSHLANGVVNDVDDGESGTVSEVLGDGCIKAFGVVRWNCNQHRKLPSRSVMIAGR